MMPWLISEEQAHGSALRNGGFGKLFESGVDDQALIANNHPVDAFQSSSTVERTATRTRNRTKESWWRLVWCHERCLKEENETRRKVLSEAARECGALLICLKKASKFEKWLSQEERPQFVLLTDWKEVKPCINIASLQSQPNKLAFTIALCETESDVSRVSTWAHCLPARNYHVQVWPDIGDPKAFVHLAHDCLQRGVVPGQNNCADGDQHRVRSEQSQIQVEDENLFTNSTEARPQMGRSGTKGRGRGRIRGVTRCGKESATHALSSSVLLEWNRPMYSYPERQILLPEAAVGEVNMLSPVCASRSSGQLEQLLKEAMPDHYDE